MKPIDPAVLVTAIRQLLGFPFPTICRHSVAADLLAILEDHGAPVSEELAGAVIRAEDAEALVLLEALASDVGRI